MPTGTFSHVDALVRRPGVAARGHLAQLVAGGLAPAPAAVGRELLAASPSTAIITSWKGG
jgi:hypothetical protein